MKKKIHVWLITLITILSLAACGSAGAEETDSADNSAQTEATEDEEEAAPEPGEESWSTAPEYSATLITTTSIRWLSVTVGAEEDEVNLTWYSPSAESGQVLWTTADDEDFESAQTFDAVSTFASEVTSGYYINRATVSGLTAETDYIYKVGNEDGMSPAYSYTTPAYSDSFRFTVIGDPQLGKPVDELDNQKTTFKRVLNKIKYHFADTSFLVSLGDQVNDFDDTEQYDAFLNQAALYSLSLVPVKGNHEIGGSQYSEHYDLPNQTQYGTCDDESDGDFWFVRGNALFLVLDLMDAEKWGEHEQFIAEACETNPDVSWRIILCHYSPYNSYEDYMENAANIRPYFLSFTDAYDIDLVLTGHDHAYSRSNFIQSDGSYLEYESPAVNPEGTMYVTLNSSSGSLYHRPSAQNEIAFSEYREAPEVTDVQVTPTTLTITTYEAETWEIVDSFEIQKSDN
ncbi:MAG: metallophosphoesterase family protein [Lachnospiraceae bacterium]|nr:metallophosphoesterase family protein [Lachnospiraceae bacterium]